MDPAQLTPSACGACSIPSRPHAQRWADAAGWHSWQAPEQPVIKARMLRRRKARRSARSARAAAVFHARGAWTGSSLGPEGELICGDCRTDGCPRFWRVQRRLARSLRTAVAPPIPFPF